jgi:3-polyprenyl-4-hydroxybenzoate decarboxylase
VSPLEAAVIVGVAGASGIVEGTALADIVEYGPVPTALVAATRK